MSRGCKKSTWEGERLHNRCLGLASSPRHTMAFVKPHNLSGLFHQCDCYFIQKWRETKTIYGKQFTGHMKTVKRGFLLRLNMEFLKEEHSHFQSTLQLHCSITS